MSRSLSYIFPVANVSDVCAAQTTAGAGNLVLNGNLANSINSQVPFINYGYSRSISIASTGNLSGVNFTITGTQNGVPVTQTVAGPNNTTIYPGATTVIYDVITSVSVNGVVGTAVTVGTGYTGFFPLIGINLEVTVLNYALTTAQLTTNSINTTIFSTLKNIFQNGSTFLNTVLNDSNLISIKTISADKNYYASSTVDIDLASFILIQINGVAGQVGNSIQMNFIQSA